MPAYFRLEAENIIGDFCNYVDILLTESRKLKKTEHAGNLSGLPHGLVDMQLHSIASEKLLFPLFETKLSNLDLNFQVKN